MVTLAFACLLLLAVLSPVCGAVVNAVTGPRVSESLRVAPSPLSLEDDMAHLAWVSLIGVVLMAFVLLFAYMLRKTKARWLPDSSVAIIAGTVIGLVVYLFDPALVTPSDGSPSVFAFSPRMFFFVFLPPIILDAGYSLNKRYFFSNISTVLLYAGPGVVISTCVVGLAALAASHVGVFGGTPFGLLESLMFGSLLSVTDSVATISILGSPDLDFDSSLYSVVFGESVFNDAVGILVFDTLAKYSRANALAFDFPSLSVSLLVVFAGSILLGIAVGFLASFVFKNLDLHDYPHFEFLLICLFAYTAYTLALVMQLSGVMSLFVCGVVLGHYNWHNISTPSKTSTKFGFKAFSVACEMAVFVYLGITFTFSLTPHFHFRWSLPGCIVAFILVWLGRASFVFPMSWLANTFVRAQPLTWPMQVIIFVSGLRGAVSFALALNIHGEHFDVMITTTLAIVIITSLVCGSFTDRIIRHYSAQIKAARAAAAAIAAGADAGLGATAIAMSAVSGASSGATSQQQQQQLKGISRGGARGPGLALGLDLTDAPGKGDGVRRSESCRSAPGSGSGSGAGSSSGSGSGLRKPLAPRRTNNGQAHLQSGTMRNAVHGNGRSSGDDYDCYDDDDDDRVAGDDDDVDLDIDVELDLESPPPRRVSQRGGLRRGGGKRGVAGAGASGPAAPAGIATAVVRVAHDADADADADDGEGDAAAESARVAHLARILHGDAPAGDAAGGDHDGEVDSIGAGDGDSNGEGEGDDGAAEGGLQWKNFASWGAFERAVLQEYFGGPASAD